MNKLFAVLVALVATFLITFPSPATAKTYTVYKGGKVEKSVTKNGKVTTIDTTAGCYAVNVGPDVFRHTDNSKSIFVTPSACMAATGIWFEGTFIEINYLGDAGVLSYFEVTPEEGYGFLPDLGELTTGDEVFVKSANTFEMKIGKETISAFASETFIFASVAGLVEGGTRRMPTCGATGCQTKSEDLNFGFVLLDKAIIVPPGTAVINDRGQTAGIVFGHDKGTSLVMTSYGVRVAAELIGVYIGGRG